MQTTAAHLLDRERLAGLADSLSASSQVIGRLNQILRNVTCSLDDVARVVSSDPALSARVVRVANGAFFGAKARVKTLPEALQRVGLREVYRIVGIAALQNLIPAQLRAYNISGQTFLRASLFSAMASQLIATEAKLDPHAAYLAGLMRPIGVLVLNRHGLEQFEDVDRLASVDAVTLAAWERRHFGLSHAEASAMILDHWSFAEPLTRSVGAYSREEDDDPLSTVLHAAGALAVPSHATLHPRDHDHTLRRDWLERLGISSSVLPSISLKALRAAREIEAC